MTAPEASRTERALCPAVGKDGRLCDFVAHPGFVHWTWINGWPQPWSAETVGWENEPTVPADPLQDAPAALRAAAEHEGCGADGCVTFGGCAVCGPEAEFEAALRKDTCACGWAPEEHDPAEHSPAPHVQVRPPRGAAS